ncbi:MAG: ferredoxin--NADP reductase [Anaerolineales bacterium]|nr:ferredoxin--NADP reductase [Anaerolineales bacterium]
MEESKYNATVVGKILLTPEIMTLRVNTDEPRDKFSAGQYTLVGLYGFEGRSENSTLEGDPADSEKLIQRPYSIASATTETGQFEFYISQVKSGQLTPRLFNLQPGDRIFVSKRIVGVFKLAETPPDQDIVMIATGTGMAPYLSFLRSYLTSRPESKMAMIQGAARQWDLGYRSELTFLENSFENFTYIPTLTEADPTWNGHKLWIEEMLNQDILKKEAGIDIDPKKTHFFLCGNPKMVENVSGWLSNKGYVKHTRKEPGSLHIEEFWS